MRRRWLLYLLIILFLWVFISQYAEIQKLAATLVKGQWQWVVLAALLQVVYYLVFASMYRAAFFTVEIRTRVRDLLPAIFSMMFVNVVAPSGGTSGMALLVDETSPKGQSRARAAAGVLLAHIIDFSTFTLVLLIGLISLVTYHDLKLYEITAAVILLLVIGGMAGILVLGVWQPQRLGRLFGWIESRAQALSTRLHLRPILAPGWAEKNAAEFTEAALAIATHPERLSRALLLGLSAHVVDLASLYMLFLAFHEHVGPGILIAGFAMGILFWVVSITPQGIGVVEGMMTLTYASLGVPLERATVIALSFRFLTFWLPFFAGFLILPRLRTFQPGRRPAAGETSVQMVSILTAGMGLINVLSAVTPSIHNRIEVIDRFSPLMVRQGSHLTAALAGFALLMLASGLWRRKRIAWLLTLLVLFVSILSHLLKGLDYEEAGIAAFLGAWLVYLHPHFHARSDPPSMRQGLVTLAAATAFTLLYGTAGFYLLDRHFQTNFLLLPAIRQTIVMFTQFYDPGLQPLTGFGRYFAGSIYAVGAVTFGYALLMLARPVLMRHPPNREAATRARAIIEQHGRTALARLAFLPDKQFFFSPGGAVVSYVVKGRVAATLGDPIGPTQDIPRAIQAFMQFCLNNDWIPAFYQVLPDFLDAYKQAGFSAISIGQEAIVSLADFSLEGRTNKGLRSGYNKIARLGYRAEILPSPVPPDLMSELREVSDEWLTDMHGTEKRFSLGWFDEDYLNSTKVMAVYDPQGELISFANILPEYARSEATIDMMRHRQSLENGVMDFLFVSLLTWAREQGLATFSLGLSSLAGIGEKPEDPAIERALHYIFEHVNRFYNFKGLHEYKDKFHPDWQPRYLVFPNPAVFPSIVLALIRADSGDHWIGSYLQA